MKSMKNFTKNTNENLGSESLKSSKFLQKRLENLSEKAFFLPFFLIFSSFAFFSCSKKLSDEEKLALKNQRIEEAKSLAIKNFVASLPAEEKISELFFVNVEGNRTFRSVENVPASFGLAQKKPLVPGGVLLFSYNISKDPLETYEFIKSIHDFYVQNSLVPPYIAVDQEGGDVSRLRNLTSALPSQKKISSGFSADEASKIYAAQAKQMRLLGINLNLAPVVEAENASNSEFLGTRTFGDAEKVLSYGKNAVSSYESNGILTSLKHFPGNSSTDPHTGLPKIRITKSVLENDYLLPFKNLLPLSSAVLMSHACVSLSDDENYSESDVPSCLSKFWVEDVVRGNLGFSGLVISDDIFMGALSENGFPPEIASVKAIEAGIDVLMLSEKRFGNAASVLYKKSLEDSGFAEKIDDAVYDVVKFKIKCGILSLEEINETKEIKENSDNEKSSRKSESENQENFSFKVSVNKNYPEFDLSLFDKFYNEGQNSFKSEK